VKAIISGIIATAIAAGCAGGASVKKPLDQPSFEAAKAKCGLIHARYFKGGFGLALPPGQDAPNAEQRRQLKCMDHELSNFDYHVVIESPPPA
jgi:hypothetical protein